MAKNDVTWQDIREELQASTKQRLRGLELFLDFLQHQTLDKVQVEELLDLSPSLLADNNFKVAQQTLEALDVVVLREQEGVKPFANVLIPAVVERFGDSKQPVRALALQVLVSLFKVLKADFVFEKIAPFWQHKNWKVKHGLLQAVAEAVSTIGPGILSSRDQNNAVLKQITKMVEDPDMSVRDAAIDCLGEVAMHMPTTVSQLIQSSSLRSMQQREVVGRLNAKGAINMPMPEMSEADMKRGKEAVQDTADSSYTCDRRPATEDATVRVDIKRAAPIASTAPAKRGGFKDSGSMMPDGEMPAATPLTVTSERELRSELETATATLALAPNAEWQQRMSAMVRVEGLLLGGSGDSEVFVDALKGLASALSQQFKERRSTIARQACHLIGILAATFGPRFEQYALIVLPTLFGVLVITIQVMAESADMGVRTILAHCQSGRILQCVTETQLRDKNPKIRQFCAGFLQLILESWDVSVWSRQLDVVEAAIKAGAQDSGGETRSSARASFALYSSALPDRAQAFIRRLDQGLQDKLSQGASKAGKSSGPTVSRQALKAVLASRPASAAAEVEIVVMAPGASRAERVERPPASAVGGSAYAQSHQPHHQVAPNPFLSQRGAYRTMSTSASGAPVSGPQQMEAVPEASQAAAPAKSRKSNIGLPPGRIPGGSLDLAMVAAESSSSSAGHASEYGGVSRPGARRQSAIPRTGVPSGSDVPRRVPPPATPAASGTALAGSNATKVAATDPQPLNMQYAGAAAAAPPAGGRTFRELAQQYSSGAPPATAHNAYSHSTPTEANSIILSRPAPLSRVVATVQAGPRTWNERMEAFNALAASVTSTANEEGIDALDAGAGPASTVVRELERIRERCFEALEDPHVKVLAAALDAVHAIVKYYSRVFEASLDRLLPLLFNKGSEGKEHIRALCDKTLAVCCRNYRADALLPALHKSLEAVKVPRGRLMVLDMFMASVVQQARELEVAPVNLNLPHFRQWVVRMAPLLDDRAPDLRKKAQEVASALLAMPWARDAMVAACANSTHDVAPLRRLMNKGNSASDGTATIMVNGSAAGANGYASHAIPAAWAQPDAAMSSVAAPYAKLQPYAPSPSSTSGGYGSEAGAGLSASGSIYCSPGQSRLPNAPGITGSSSSPFTTQQQARMAILSGSSLPHASHKPALPVAAEAHADWQSTSSSSGGGGGYAYDAKAAISSPPQAAAQEAPRPDVIQQQTTHLYRLLDAARVQGLHHPELCSSVVGLAQAAQDYDREVWIKAFPLLSLQLGAWMTQTEARVQEMAYTLLLQLLRHQPSLFTDSNLQVHLTMLLQGADNADKEVSKVVDLALKQLLGTCNVHKAMHILMVQLPRQRELCRQSQASSISQHFRLAEMLRAVLSLLPRLSRLELDKLAMQAHPDTRQSLVEIAISNVDDVLASVRKMSIILLANLWWRLGHSVRDTVQVLAPGCASLVGLYYLKLHGYPQPFPADTKVVMQHPLISGPAPLGGDADEP